jgi:hypothetical protein
LKETHVREVKRIFIYIKGTSYFGLWYLKENELTLVSYTDAYWEGRIDDKIITGGEDFYFGDFQVS